MYNLAMVFCVALGVLGASVSNGQTDVSTLEVREGLFYAPNSTEPFSGDIFQGNLKGQIENGLRHGKWIAQYPSGQTQFEMVFDRGDRLSTKSWFETGEREDETFFLDGLRHGESRSWDRNGNVRSIFRYERGKQHGLQEVFDDAGERTLTSEYSDGIKHGETTWWFDSESKRWETHYAQGKRTGKWSQFTRNGNISMESVWANDTLISRIDHLHSGH